MKKRFSWLALILAILVTALITFQITFLAAFKHNRNNPYGTDFSDMENLMAVDYAYRNYFYGDVDRSDIEEGLIAGYLYGTGDAYGEYMDAEEYASFISDNKGEKVGIGISVVPGNNNTGLEIVNVLSDSPAEESDVRIGDVIVSVKDESVAELGYYGAVDAMQGEAGTNAVFTVLRDNEYIDFDITRRAVTQESVLGRMYEDGVTGILRIEEFDALTPSQFKSEIETLTEAGAQRFVFDVRNNPGGDLESIVEVLDYLLPEGPIIRIDDKDGNETVRSSDEKCFDKPMAVLVNSSTASAAELFASALKDYEAAVLVGKTTFGKGSMQTIVPLVNGSALRITFRMYKPPYSDSYDGIGVVPDISIDMADDVKNISLYKIEDNSDTQLMRAIEYLNTGK